MFREHVLKTKLTTEECKKHIAEHGQPEHTFLPGISLWPEDTVFFSIKENAFKLTVRKAAPPPTELSPGQVRIRRESCFRGRLEESSDGTTIRGRFFLSTLEMVIVCIWCACGLLLVCIITSGLVTDRGLVDSGGRPWLLEICGGALELVGISFIGLNWRNGGTQRQRLMEFMRNRLEACEVERK